MGTTTKPLTIGEVARRAGVGVETIRFYERRGLLAQPPKPRDGGFRAYPAAAAERVHFIRQAQDLGFSLREIHDLLALKADPQADCAEVREQAQAKLEDVERKIAQLNRMRAALRSLVATCPGHGGLGGCTIMDALAMDGLVLADTPREAAPHNPMRTKGSRPMKTATFAIEGMHCGGCAANVSALLRQQPGVQAAEASFADRQARVMYDSKATNEAALIAAVERLGYKAAIAR